MDNKRIYMKGRMIARYSLICGNCERELSLDTTNREIAKLRRDESGWRIRRPYGYTCPECNIKLDEEWEASIKKTADAAWAKMTDFEKEQTHKLAVSLGISRDTRSPLDRMIDKACGLE